MTANYTKIGFVAILFAFVLLNNSCEKDVPVKKHLTDYVFVVVVDGARYTETWGDSSHQFIPHRFAMLNEGVMCSNFYNNGPTFTNPGHGAICTGNYEFINASGLQHPTQPSFFQYFLKKYNRSATEAWVISSKDKLVAVSNCTDTEWKDKYRPMTDCGVAGIATGYRQDSITFSHLLNTLQIHHPRLVLNNFREPDYSGHAGDYGKYIKGIKDTDEYIDRLWKFIQSDPVYKNKTTLIVTNDHGRHTTGHLDGFVSHGDDCFGCKKIEFFGIGPDFKKNYVSSINYEQIDISQTIAKLLHFEMPTSHGKTMNDIFSDN